MSRRGTTDGLDRLMERKSRLADRAATGGVAQRLGELRAWQATRLTRTYADVGRDGLAGDALRFFVSDLYGPQVLTPRDQDIVRAWPLLKRALPPRMLAILTLAMELDVISAELDLEMTERLLAGPLTAAAYADAYRAVGRAEARQRQIGLVVEIGNALVRAVRSPLVGLALRAAHGPAHLTGLGALQDFLERGFAAFRKLPRPTELLETIERRETKLMQIILAGGVICAEEPPVSRSGSA